MWCTSCILGNDVPRTELKERIVMLWLQCRNTLYASRWLLAMQCITKTYNTLGQQADTCLHTWFPHASSWSSAMWYTSCIHTWFPHTSSWRLAMWHPSYLLRYGCCTHQIIKWWYGRDIKLYGIKQQGKHSDTRRIELAFGNRVPKWNLVLKPLGFHTHQADARQYGTQVAFWDMYSN